MDTDNRRAFLQKVAVAGMLSSQTAIGYAGVQQGARMGELDENRYMRGWQMLQEIDGEAGNRVIESLRDIAPDLGRFIIEFPFGDVYTRPGLDLRTREIATVAALCALGNATPQLKVHLHGALNVNVTPQEIVEVIIQMAIYAGFPAALNGMFTAKEVFAERNKA